MKQKKNKQLGIQYLVTLIWVGGTTGSDQITGTGGRELSPGTSALGAQYLRQLDSALEAIRYHILLTELEVAICLSPSQINSYLRLVLHFLRGSTRFPVNIKYPFPLQTKARESGILVFMLKARHF